MSKAELASFLRRAERLFVITGAGCSAPSGIDTYRDDAGQWQRSAPVQHQDFVANERARQRYWARSLRGWPGFRDAVPSGAHHALAALESGGRIQKVVTQNVDGLHQRAGQRQVIELHGSLARVICLQCASLRARDTVQTWLETHNRQWLEAPVEARPDGDAAFTAVRQFDDFSVPSCDCGGVLKPDVVFYGDSVPRSRVEAVRSQLEAADALLVIGSSLMVYSSFRFVKEAHALGLPLAAINRGRTRADEWFDSKWTADSAAGLTQLVQLL